MAKVTLVLFHPMAAGVWTGERHRRWPKRLTEKEAKYNWRVCSLPWKLSPSAKPAATQLQKGPAVTEQMEKKK